MDQRGEGPDKFGLQAIYLLLSGELGFKIARIFNTKAWSFDQALGKFIKLPYAFFRLRCRLAAGAG